MARKQRKGPEDRAWADYSETVRTGLIPKLLSSAVCLQIYSGDGSDFDVKQATELGAMLLMDKPLVLIAIPGAVVPTRLARAADVVLRDFDVHDPSDQVRLNAALRRFAGEAD